MKPCFGKRKLLAWLALGELDEPRAKRLRSHVLACEGCRRYLESLAGVRERLAAADTSQGLQPSAFFHRKWVARLEAGSAGRMWAPLRLRLSWGVALPALGTASALVLVGFALFHNPSGHSSRMAINRAESAPLVHKPDLSLSAANYQRVAARSLDEFDELLTAQAKHRSPPAPAYIASVFTAASLQN
jgi:hypothetical protein